MCDDVTRIADDAALSRRQLGMLGAAAVVASCSGTSADGAARTGLVESEVSIPTPDGTADAFFVHPAKGSHPAILLWPDIGGLRDVFKDMARRLAGKGFAVLAVNQYYRSAKAPVLESFAQWRTPEGQAKLKPMIAQINAQATRRDAVAFVGWLDRQAGVSKTHGIGTCGFCMGGPFTVRTAAAVPDRVRAAASLHGAGLVGPDAASPDKLLSTTRASFLFAIARNDDARAPGDKDVLRAAAAAAGRPAEIEVYAADHGWTVADSPVYDKAQAERVLARMQVLFKAL